MKLAIAELSRLDKGDDSESVRLSELLYGRHFKGIHGNPPLFGEFLWFSCYGFSHLFTSQLGICLLILFKRISMCVIPSVPAAT